MLIRAFRHGQKSGRIEVVFEACGQTAILDIPDDPGDGLSARIDQALAAFCGTLPLRHAAG